MKHKFKAQWLSLNSDIQKTKPRCQDQPCVFAVVQRTLKGTAWPNLSLPPPPLPPLLLLLLFLRKSHYNNCGIRSRFITGQITLTPACLLVSFQLYKTQEPDKPLKVRDPWWSGWTLGPEQRAGAIGHPPCPTPAGSRPKQRSCSALVTEA